MPEQLVKVWPRAIIVESITDAIGIVEEIAPPDDLRIEAFKAALQMSCQRRAEPSSIAAVRGANGVGFPLS